MTLTRQAYNISSQKEYKYIKHLIELKKDCLRQLFAIKTLQ